MTDILVFCLGLGFGLSLSAIVLYVRRADLKAHVKDTEQIKASIQSISEQTLSQSIERLLKINEQQQTQFNTHQSKDLSHQKGLIDQSLSHIKKELDQVHKTMMNLEKDREKSLANFPKH